MIAVAAIFADAGVQDHLTQPSRAGEQRRWEVRGGEQRFQIAGPGGIIMDAEAIEGDRGGRYQIAAESNRADEPVLDPHQRHARRARGLRHSG